MVPGFGLLTSCIYRFDSPEKRVSICLAHRQRVLANMEELRLEALMDVDIEFKNLRRQVYWLNLSKPKPN